MNLIKVEIESICDGDTLTVSPVGVPTRFKDVLYEIKRNFK